jgi:type VI secretion system protein ImpF
MPTNESVPGWLPSLVDRLLDPESSGTAWQVGYSQELMEASVRRDLEDLLNTRRSYTQPEGTFPEVEASVVAYGIPDLTSLRAITDDQCKEIAKMLARHIARHEPRLRKVEVDLLDRREEDPTIGFRIRAELILTPGPQVDLQTILEISTGKYSVKHYDSHS